jgi:glycosyltransferase involved in cell wall biosynthesis
MKIAIAGPSGGLGGLEVHTKELTDYLHAQGHSVLKIQVFPPRVGILGKAEKLSFWASSCMRIRFFKPHLLIAVGFGHGYAVLSNLSGRNCFCIQQVVTDELFSQPDTIKSVLAPFDAIGAQTPALMQAVEHAFGSIHPIAVLPCFHQITTTPYAPCFAPPVGEGIRLAYFGRLAGNKGLSLLLQTIAELALPTLVQLDIWGSGPMREELENQIHDHPVLVSCASLKGHYPDGHAYLELLASYHGFVLPSQACEGLPLVLLEAASVGLPILTTNIGGIADFGQGNPDVLMMDVGIPALCAGLAQFVNDLQSGRFQRPRLQAFFANHYSRTAIENTWNVMLKDHQQFFGSSARPIPPSLSI